MDVNLCALFPYNSLTHHAAAPALSINTPQRYRGRKNGCKDVPEYWTPLSPSFNIIYMGWCLHLSAFWTFQTYISCVLRQGAVCVFQRRGSGGARGDSLAEAHDFFIPLILFTTFTALLLIIRTAILVFFFPIQTWHIRPLHCLIYTLVRSVQLFFPSVLFLSVRQSCLLWWKHSVLTTCPMLYAILMAQSFIKSPGNGTKKTPQKNGTSVPIEPKSHMVKHSIPLWQTGKKKKSHDHLSAFHSTHRPGCLCEKSQ